MNNTKKNLTKATLRDVIAELTRLADEEGMGDFEVIVATTNEHEYVYKWKEKHSVVENFINVERGDKYVVIYGE